MKIEEFVSSKPERLELCILEVGQKKIVYFPEAIIETVMAHQVAERSYLCADKDCQFCQKGIDRNIYCLFPAIDVGEQAPIMIKAMLSNSSGSLANQIVKKLKSNGLENHKVFEICKVSPQRITFTPKDITVNGKELEEMSNYRSALAKIDLKSYFSKK